MNIPEEIVEKAARAISPDSWRLRDSSTLPVGHEGRDAVVRKSIEQARAALSAAAPLLMAQAWEEGEDAGRENAHLDDWPTFPLNTNPYRKEQS